MTRINMKLAEVAPFDVAIKRPRLVFHLEQPKAYGAKAVALMTQPKKHQVYHPIEGPMAR